MLDYLIFKIGGFFSDQELLVIKNNGVDIVIDYYKHPRNWSSERCFYSHKSIDQAKFEELCDRILNAGIESWEDDYSDNQILDGVQWSVRYKLKQQDERKIYGSNSFPQNWVTFLSVVHAIKHEIGEPVEEDINSMIYAGL